MQRFGPLQTSYRSISKYFWYKNKIWIRGTRRTKIEGTRVLRNKKNFKCKKRRIHCRIGIRRLRWSIQHINIIFFCVVCRSRLSINFCRGKSRWLNIFLSINEIKRVKRAFLPLGFGTARLAVNVITTSVGEERRRNKRPHTVSARREKSFGLFVIAARPVISRLFDKWIAEGLRRILIGRCARAFSPFSACCNGSVSRGCSSPQIYYLNQFRLHYAIHFNWFAVRER